MTDFTPIYIVRGVGGSHAHGLSHATSDFDYRGVMSFPTDAWWGLQKPPETIDGHEPEDHSAHELEKFLRLAAKGNPDVLEVLALDTYLDFEAGWGDRLLELTPKLLGTEQIRAAYMGYAMQQFSLLKKRAAEGNASFSAGMKSHDRIWKHAKHMFRLMETGHRILSTGKLDIRVQDREWYLEKLPEMTLEQLILSFETRFAVVKDVKSVLPPTNPDYDAINGFIYDYRKAH